MWKKRLGCFGKCILFANAYALEFALGIFTNFSNYDIFILVEAFMKKGFTLIELLAVIVILGIVLLIVMPSVAGILNRSQNRLNDEQEAAVLSAARQWGISNLIESDGKIYKDGEEISYITLSELQASGYLEDSEIQDMTDKSEIDSETKICITYENYQFVYEFDGEC